MQQALIVATLFVASLASAQPLNLKLGAWETTHKGAAFPRPMVDKECITKADLQQLAGRPDKDDDDACKLVRPATVSANKWSADRQCSDGRRVHAEFVADSPERISGSIVSTAAKGGPAMRIEVAGRWLGASCAGIK